LSPPPYTKLKSGSCLTIIGTEGNAVAVDVWLANTDRNIGNVLARPRSDKKFELVFIDFEKSLTLRPFPVILSNIQPGKLWPTGDLGHEIRAKKTLVPP